MAMSLKNAIINCSIAHFLTILLIKFLTTFKNTKILRIRKFLRKTEEIKKDIK
jgi:hypothetical protein